MKTIHALLGRILGGVRALIFSALIISFAFFLANKSFCFSVSTFLTLGLGLGLDLDLDLDLGLGLDLAFALLRFAVEALEVESFDLGFGFVFAFGFFSTGCSETSELGFSATLTVVAAFFFRVVVVLPVCAFGLDTGRSV